MDSSSIKKLYNQKPPALVQTNVNEYEKLTSNSLKSKLHVNFSKDVEQSLSNEQQIYKGLEVSVKSNYKLSSKDKAWFHPDLVRTRVMFKLNTASKITNKAFSDGISSAASYYKNSVDELGDIKQEHFLIVDTGISDVLKEKYNGFFDSKKSIKEVYDFLNISKLDGKSLQAYSLNKALGYVENAVVLASYHYNMLYKGANEYHFYNHVIKPVQGKALVHVSPLVGFSEIQTSSPLPSDLLSQSEYININALGKPQRERVFNSCNWVGSSAVNTFTMRKPIQPYKKMLKDSVVYRMSKGSFSDTKVADKLPLDVILFLTPEAKNIPESRSAQFHTDVKNNLVRMKITDDSLSKLIPFYKQLFKENFIEGEHFVISRDLAKKL
ncbi:MAG: hypothetical protein CMF41_07070 [Legionellales bacterium]|nr:hypothetical protein [Legionellales bacterium]OUX63557.1 MAG: hypothetical protein CBE41_04695 [Gammaproteobacteria bacterium TMED281]|tara:strand:- start:3191 stop:4336 length:1146 start_codon:yes stop_codon:yes gene_type:complete